MVSWSCLFVGATFFFPRNFVSQLTSRCSLKSNMMGVFTLLKLASTTIWAFYFSFLDSSVAYASTALIKRIY